MQNEHETDYKNTLNLPQTTLEMRANAAVKEIETQKFWEENNIYQKMVAKNKGKNKFVLHDGPPYLSSAKIHIGTALNKILKDIVIKYKTQQGCYAPYVPGYDGHGLPIENAVVKNIKGGREALTPFELRQKCREFALTNLKGQESEFKRLGVLGDWENPYLTIAAPFEGKQIRIFGEMYKKGYIEKGLKPVYWCSSCETALAEAEVEYADHTSTSIYVRFKFDKEDAQKVYASSNVTSNNNLFAIIWTTTPWTIPSNMAICVNANLEYVVLEYNSNCYVVAEGLLANFLSGLSIEESEIKLLGKLKGKPIEGLKTTHPLYERKSPILLGDHVTLEAGTGLVHTAPGHGLEDWEVCQKYNIETFSPINEKGVWTSAVPDLEGVPYYKGNSIVIENLEKAQALMGKSDISHSYPHCWRCKKPVMYRATAQWFVKVAKFKKETLEEIKNVQWIPKSGEARISNMVEGRTDWCISRQRAWGVPIPVFYCKDCGEIVVNDQTISHIANLFEKESSDAWVKYDVKDLMPKDMKCPKCKGENFKKETDIMDVWFDSGCTWATVVNARKDELGETPVEMYLEGSDQHRGWFQSSLLTSMAVTGKAPYKSVLTHGFVLDGEGRKMSKSLGNFVLPQEIIKVYGADVLRLWAASVDYRNDIKIGDNIIKQLVEIFKKTRNTARFLMGNIYDFDPSTDYVEYKDLKNIDKFALHKLNTLIQNVTESFESFEFYKYFQHLQNFAAVDLSAFYLDIVKDRLYTAGKKSLSRRACQTVLFETLKTLCKVLVPVMPHQAEDIFRNIPACQRCKNESVLLTSWVESKPEWENIQIEEEFTKILKLRELVSRTIEPLRAEKKVGSSLEVAVTICGGEQGVLKKYEKELGNIFITSQAILTDKPLDDYMNILEEDGYQIFVTKAQGEKCERCWKYRKLGTIKGHETICEECYEAIQ